MTTTTKPGGEGRIQVTSEELQKTVDTSKWFPQDVKIPPQARTLLEQYSGFAPDEVLSHVVDLVCEPLGKTPSQRADVLD